uniref:Uncharacterized protein n=1 Tax=viral metagenome TaxID=1070528 RepID=A0A6H2A0Z9_9ZZZZ
MAKFEVEAKLVQDVLNYLAEKSYKEVTVLISQLMQLKRIEEPKEPDKLPGE